MILKEDIIGVKALQEKLLQLDKIYMASFLIVDSPSPLTHEEIGDVVSGIYAFVRSIFATQVIIMEHLYEQSQKESEHGDPTA